ncbi:MAG: hypoxanthine phosphoribosyltransferase [Christensenellaceae bacterium]
MHQDCKKMLLTAEQIDSRVQEIANQLNRDYADKNPLVVGVLKGSIVFYTDLIRKLEMPMEMDFMAVSSYGSGTTSSGFLKMKKDIDSDIEGRHVIIVEDIIDSGYTLTKVKKVLAQRHPASVRVVVLLDKSERRVVAIEPDYACFDIEDEFVIGYGLDYDEKYRNLPYIGVLKESVYL